MPESLVQETEIREAASAPVVLVVDDDELFRQSIVGALRRRGFEVHEADTVCAARASLKSLRAHSILLDIRMPGELGIELIAPIKKQYPETKIIVLTGYGSIATAVAAMKLGADEYLTKPAALNEVLAAIEGRREMPLEFSDAGATLSEIEREHIQKVLLETGGNISKAAKILGIHRRSLQRKLANLGEA